MLCQKLVSRQLFKIELQKEPFEKAYLERVSEITASVFKIDPLHTRYFVLSGHTENNAYDPGVGNILILQKNGLVSDMAEITEQLNIRVLSHPVRKNFLCYPKEVWEILNK
jgi:uncharacterized protein